MERLMKELSALPEEEDPLDAREQDLLGSLASAGDSPLAVRVQERGGIPVLILEGELDVSTAGYFRERLDRVLEGHPEAVIVDLSYADYIDSRGMGILLQAATKLGGTLAVVTPKERVARLFQATGLTTRVMLHRSLPEAVDALKKAIGG